MVRQGSLTLYLTPRLPHSPLMVAGRHGKPEAIAALIEAGAHVSRSNDKQQTALHFSVGGGCPRCVQQLLTARAKINYKDTESNTALILAAKLANPDISAMLLNERANPNIKVYLFSVLRVLVGCWDVTRALIG